MDGSRRAATTGDAEFLASMLVEIVNWARRAGIARVSLSVERANPAWTLYTAEGYRTTASGRDSDTLVVEVARPT